ncbi:hypothetical protein [Devosia sp. Root635]|uniref:hypothetical protein n=1 Tax=Devosia sp. Root635 TaxID=1736575 RepID=UPI0006FF6C54|nr:hypothetical protein [Devosia sp. Root635]KRA42080.1 hypothetical protein ASD80_10155 [Devosia sp. Root635]
MKVNRLLFWVLLACLLLAVVGPQAVSDDFVAARYLPSPLNYTLFFLCIVLVCFIRDPLSRIVAAGWALWLVVGNLFIFGSHFRRRLAAPLYVQDANTLFLIATACFCGGIVAFEFLRRPQVEGKPRELSKLATPAALALYAFPVVYALSLVVWRVPTILSGENIVDLMYEVDRGPVYALRTVLIMTTIAIVASTKRLARLEHTFFLVAVVVALLLLSILDGKRDLALAAVIGMGAHFLIVRNGNVRFFHIVAVLATAIAYSIISDVRAARVSGNEPAILYIITALGVEYKDFVHSINYLSIEKMQSIGYDWWKSSVASLLNRSLLGVFGVDKDAWVQMDSARAWMRAYGITLGIRTGIVSEMYYAFGYFVFAATAILGFLLAFIVRRIRKAKSVLGYVYWLAMFATFSMSIMGQTTSVLGAFVTLTYAVVGVFLLSRVFAPRLLFAPNPYQQPTPIQVEEE